MRDVEDVGPNDIGNVPENLRQTLCIVGFIDILDVGTDLLCARRIANIVDVETQCFRKVVEAV